MKYLIFFVALLSIFSCSDKQIPDEIIPASKMEILLWEQMQADAFTKEFLVKDSSVNLDSANIAIQEKIFAKNKITSSQFYKSYYYYLNHQDKLRVILDSITIKQVKIKENEGLIKAQLEK